jgi:hypothetical protein
MARAKIRKRVADSWSKEARFNSLMLIAFAFFMGWLFAKDVSLLLSSGNWQTTSAHILQSKVNKGQRGGPDSPWIQYSYVVDDQNYASDRIDFGEWSHGDVPTFLQSYPVGAEREVYYNPDKPSEAVLIKSGSLLVNLLLCLLAWGSGTITCYYRFFKCSKD